MAIPPPAHGGQTMDVGKRELMEDDLVLVDRGIHGKELGRVVSGPDGDDEYRVVFRDRDTLYIPRKHLKRVVEVPVKASKK